MAVVTIGTVSRTRMSRVPTFDAVVIDYSSNVAFTDYQVRRVSAAADTVTMGNLLESGSFAGSAGVTYQATISDDELVAGAGAEGNNLVKVFIKDLGGVWSGAVALTLPFTLPVNLMA